MSHPALLGCLKRTAISEGRFRKCLLLLLCCYLSLLSCVRGGIQKSSPPSHLRMATDTSLGCETLLLRGPRLWRGWKTTSAAGLAAVGPQALLLGRGIHEGAHLPRVAPRPVNPQTGALFNPVEVTPPSWADLTTTEIKFSVNSA